MIFILHSLEKTYTPSLVNHDLYERHPGMTR